MNKFAFALVILAAMGTQAAEKKTQETIVTCQQAEGDQWIEVGIIMNDGPGQSAIVVENNDDDQSSKLIVYRAVTAGESSKGTVYEDKFSTFKLVLAKNKKSARLNLLADGPNSISNLKMDCIKKSTISYSL
jgi:hypothetical protein